MKAKSFSICSFLYAQQPTKAVYLLQLLNLHGHIIKTKSLQFILRLTLGVVTSRGLEKYILTFISHCGILQSIFTAAKFLALHLFIFPASSPDPTPQLLIFLLSSIAGSSVHKTQSQKCQGDPVMLGRRMHNNVRLTPKPQKNSHSKKQRKTDSFFQQRERGII